MTGIGDSEERPFGVKGELAVCAFEVDGVLDAEDAISTGATKVHSFDGDGNGEPVEEGVTGLGLVRIQPRQSSKRFDHALCRSTLDVREVHLLAHERETAFLAKLLEEELALPVFGQDELCGAAVSLPFCTSRLFRDVDVDAARSLALRAP